MCIGNIHSEGRFDLADIGVIDNSPVEAFDDITDLAVTALGAQTLAFLVADAQTQSLIVRASAWLPSIAGRALSLPLTGSLTQLVLDENRPVTVNDVASAPTGAAAVELARFRMQSFLGVPVHGPAGEPLGTLAAMNARPQVWTDGQQTLLKKYAYLLSQQVLLRAALETLRLVAREKSSVRQA